MYSVHSSVFGKCGYTMRPVLISDDDDALFNANFTPRVAVTYQNHVKEIRRMVKQQGIGFWIRYVTSFRSHNERHRLMDGIVFPRAEAVFVDMLHLLTCGDNLNELTRLVSSLRAMQAAITANDYHVLMDPVLRVLMTCYDKPLDGLRLYFRFVAGLVVMFRRWRQVAWRTKKENEVLLPWEPPLHWQEMTSRDYSEWTFEGHLLGMFGPDLPHLLGLPPGLPSWLPDELKNGHLLYPAIAMEEVPILQDISGRGRNRKKCRRRKNRQFDDGFPGYDPYSTNAAPSSGDSGVCLIEQGQDTVTVDIVGPQKTVAAANIADVVSDAHNAESTMTLEKEQPITVMMGIDLINGSATINGKSSAEVLESHKDFADTEAPTCTDKSCPSSQADGMLQEAPCSTEETMEIVCTGTGKESKQGIGYMRTEDYVKDSDEYVEENFTVPYEERPDYLYVLECRGPGLVQSSQYIHPGGIPILEQNYGSSYDQCLHIYRRDGPPRIMMNTGNFRPNCHMEELHPLGRPSPWVESPGNFMHSSPIGYFDTPMIDYIGPSSEMRRRGQPNRRFRQRRGRQTPYLATIEECFDSATVNETQTCAEVSSVAQSDATLGLSSGHKKQWHHKKRLGASEPLKEETTATDETKIKTSVTDEVSNAIPIMEVDDNKPASVDTSATGSCIKDYALAVCGLLGRSGKGPEVKKDLGNPEENPKIEVVSSKASTPCDIRNSRKCKGKPGKPFEDESGEKSGKSSSLKDVMRDAEKGKKFGGKTEGSNIVTDFGKPKITKGKMTNRSIHTVDIGKEDKSGTYNEANNILPSHLGKDLTSNVNIGKTSVPGHEEEKVLEKKRKWKSVWTRRRETETRNPEEKSVSENDGVKEKEVTNRYNPEGREGVPENVPDILKQVENSELKAFWKENYDAPKPQRKSRPSRRDSKWRPNTQESSVGSDFNQNTKKDDVTHIAKLDVVPAVEPSDKDNLPQESNLQLLSVEQTAADSCLSEIGWYEETLAEDKDRESLGQLCGTDTGESRMCVQKKSKNRKWKRKQKNNKKTKEERNISVIKEKPNDECTAKDYNRKEKEVNNLLLDFQKKSNVDENNDQILNDTEHLMNNIIRKDNISVNGYTRSEIKNRHQKSKEVIEESNNRMNGELPVAEMQEGHHQSTECYDQSVDCCKAILEEVLIRLPEKTKNSALGKETFTDILESLEVKKKCIEETSRQNINCCNDILEGVLCPPESRKDSQRETSEDQCKGNANCTNKSTNGNAVNAEAIQVSTCKSTGCKNKENKMSLVQRRRQACFARTLKYLTGIKFNIPFPTKRDLLRFFFANGETPKYFVGLPEKDSECGVLPCLSTTSKSFGIPQPPPYRRKKILLLRRCDNCNILENSLGEYGACVRCKETPMHPPRVYCNRLCQRVDWKRRHRAEHRRHDCEQNHREN